MMQTVMDGLMQLEYEQIILTTSAETILEGQAITILSYSYTTGISILQLSGTCPPATVREGSTPTFKITTQKTPH